MRILAAFRRVLVLPLVLATAGCVGGLGTIGTLGAIAELVTSVGRPGSTAQQVRLTAEVRQVDVRRQVLQAESADGRAGGVLFDLGTTVVHEHRPYPPNAPADVAERFDRLRSGEDVQLEGYPLRTGRIELHRFTDAALDEPAAPAPAEPEEPAGPPERTERGDP